MVVRVGRTAQRLAFIDIISRDAKTPRLNHDARTTLWHRHFTTSHISGTRSRGSGGASSGRFRYLLVAMPITAFFLGTWQVQRRQEKLKLIDDMEMKLHQAPLTRISEIISLVEANESAGDSMPVRLRGRFEHSKEMLVGPRQHQGQTGYHVVTPFIVQGSRILINRGWISKLYSSQAHKSRRIEEQHQTVNGLIRRRTASNIFTPQNLYDKDEIYHIDIVEMSKRTDCYPILVEATRDAIYSTDELEAEGIPVGRPHEVLLRNNHMQYIFTWYALSAVTAVMCLSLFPKARTPRRLP